MGKHLSKSRILSGLQCAKRLWLEIYKPELSVVTDSMARLFTVGHEVGTVAQGMYPGGHLIGHDKELSEAIKETADMLKNQPETTLFEATFSFEDVLVRSDVLMKENEGYRVIEVKAATSVKDYYLNDVAVQAWVIENAGHPVEKIEIAHVNRDFVYGGNKNYDGLLKYVDVTAEARERLADVMVWVEGFKEMLSGDIPDICVGKHCSSPYSCPFIKFCTPKDAPEYPVVDVLPRVGKLADELISEGHEDVRDIPHGRLEKPLHERVRQVTITGEPYVSAELIEAMNGLPFIRYYLDFETAQFAVPVWIGTKPYQQLPAQWSLHIEHYDGQIDHAEYLDISGNPPMESFIRKLIEAVGNDGPIIVYSHFEKTILNQLAVMYPEYSVQIQGIIDRLMDLLPMLRNGYYHPDMKGSWSIKSVLPCVAPDLKYGDLEEIHEGGAAQVAYAEAIHPETKQDRKEEIRDRLLKYCQMDTMAMVRLVKFFSGEHVQ